MVDCQLPCKENLTICRAATGMAESHFLNQILINILSTATSPRISIKKQKQNKTKTKKRKKQVMWKFTSKEPGADLEVKFRRAKFKL